MTLGAADTVGSADFIADVEGAGDDDADEEERPKIRVSMSQRSKHITLNLPNEKKSVGFEDFDDGTTLRVGSSSETFPFALDNEPGRNGIVATDSIGEGTTSSLRCSH